jgi:hyaluronate lyase
MVSRLPSFLALFTAALLSAAAAASAQTYTTRPESGLLTNPPLAASFASVNLIADQGINRNATGSATPAQLQAISGFAVSTEFNLGTGAAFTSKDSFHQVHNFKHFTAANRSIRFTTTNNTNSNNSSGASTTSNILAVSGPNGVYLGAVGGSWISHEITFGQLTDPAAVDRNAAFVTSATGQVFATRAAGLIISNVQAGRSFQAIFFGTAGQPLATLTGTAVANGEEIFFGYDAGPDSNNWIQRVLITGANGGTNAGLDDVGFAPIQLVAPATLSFAAVRQRIAANSTGGAELIAADPLYTSRIASIGNAAQNLWNSLNKSPSRTQLWSDAPITSSSDTITEQFRRLLTMSVGYATNGSSVQGNAALLEDIVGALEWLNANHYSSTRPFYGNWFPWHLGAPLNVVSIFACIHDGVAPSRRTALYNAYATAIDYYQSTAGPTWANTGANRVWRARIDVGLGAALESNTRLAAGRDKLSTVLPYVTSGDGFYQDGSFIQHNTHAYTGGYGAYLIRDLASLLATLANSTWQVTDPNLSNVYRWAEEAYDPVMFRAAIMDMTRGRDVSRSGGDRSVGHVVLAAIARIAQFAPPEEAARFRSLVRGALLSDAQRDFLSNAETIGDMQVVRPILEDAALPPRPPLVGLRIFAGMDRVVHQRSDWAYGLSLSSKRISKYESINRENLAGWHQGDGAGYLYNGDLAHYSHAYWPTVDPYRLAGTTVDTKVRTAEEADSARDPRTTKSWVGGSSTQGLYGAAGMDHEAHLSDLRARKSWFFFDDEIVFLGAAITTSASNPRTIETVVENRLLQAPGSNGAPVLSVNGAAQSTTLGWSTTFAAANHAHLAVPMQAGYGNADVGYYFPQATPLKAKRESRTGTWQQINELFGSSSSITRNYLTFWIDHGSQLTGNGASYAYAMLPGKTAAQTAAYAAAPDIEILANTSTVQAVRDTSLGVTALNFWTDAIVAAAGFSSNRRASLTVWQQDDQLHLGLADPTQEQTGSIIVELPFGSSSVLQADPAITVLQLFPTIRLSVAVAGTRGRSLEASFSLQTIGANPDVAQTAPGTPLLIDALANDSAASGELALVSVTTPTSGSASIVDGKIRYVPAPNFTGLASFQYTVAAGAAQASAQVTVTVEAGPVSIAAVSASSFQEPNSPDKVIDGELDGEISRWSAQGLGEWIELDLASPHKVDAVNVAVYRGDTRRAHFELVGSLDGATWTTLFSGSSSGTALGFERIEIPNTWSRYVRLVGYGHTPNGSTTVGLWNSFAEIQILTAANLAPVAPLLAATIPVNGSATLLPLAAASDPDLGPDPLALISWTAANAGAVVRNGNSLIYTPPANFVGTANFTYTVSDGGLSATGQGRVDVGFARSYESFAQLRFSPLQLTDPAVSGPDADPDGDGLSNRLEHALGLDPLNANPQAIESGFDETDGRRLAILFTRASAATDVTIRVQASSDLATWTDLAVSANGSATQNLGAHAVSETGSHPTEVVVVDSVTSDSLQRRFLRLLLEP